MIPLLERLKEETLVCDGALGTMLMQNNMPKDVCPDLWGTENSDLLSSIHKSYIESGADMITTNTFGANRIKLKRFNLEDKVADINKRAVEIAHEASKDKAYILGDIGPTGEYLKPVGGIEPEEMLHNFKEQAELLSKAGVDAIILETMSDMEELKQAIMAVKESVKLPLIASMTFQILEGKGFRTTSGISIPQFVDYSLLAGCDVIGANCSLVIDEMIQLISEIRALSTTFIIAQANAGMPKIVDNDTVYEESPEKFAEAMPAIVKAGANIIGGCCGTTPEHIRKIKNKISTQA